MTIASPSSLLLPPDGSRLDVPVVGCAGGVGATLLCQHLGPWAFDVGRHDPPYGAERMLLVTRGTAEGLEQAVARVGRMLQASRGGRSVHLAVVDDGWAPSPVAARARVRSLRPHLAAVVRVPYVARWRYEDAPHLVPSRAYARAVRRLADLLQSVPSAKEVAS